MGVWNQKIELIGRDELEQIKMERLQATLNRAYNNVPFYRELFNEHAIVPEKVRTMDDLAGLPFTTRADLVEQQPYGFFAVPLKDIARIHSSSGTTGRPVVTGYTTNDRSHWAGLIARCLRAVGIDSSDIVQISFAYGLFSGGFGLDMGSEHMGATVIPASAGDVEQQIRVMLDYHTTCLFSTPSYAMQIGNMMKSKGIRNHELTLRKGLFGAEPWSEDIRASIEETLGIEAYDIYGISELMGPGVAGECEYKQGLHIWEDHYIAEIIDSETGKTLPPGERGELVLTTLSREAMPLIRYRTGDITVLDHEQCACGRSHVRMERVLNRSAEFVIVHGVNIYPRDIADILDKLFEIPIRFQVVVSRGEQGDVMEIRILVSDDMFSDEMRRYRHIETTLKHVMTARLSFEPMVRFVEPTSFPAVDKPYPLVVDER